MRVKIKKKFQKKSKSEKAFISEEELSYRNSFDFTCHFDGSFSFSKIGYGFCCIENTTGQVVKNYNNTVRIPKGSSDIAEYKAFTALLYFLDRCILGANILILGDSRLVVEQMNGRQAIRKGGYKEFALAAREVLKYSRQINNLTIKWVYREQNTIADDLSKCA